MRHICIPMLLLWCGIARAQDEPPSNDHVPTEQPHSVLPADGVVSYLPEHARPVTESVAVSKDVSVRPTSYFYFRPEGTNNYKEAGRALDTSHLNFYLRADVGAVVSLPADIDLVLTLQSYGVYTVFQGPLNKNITLYEGYVDLKGKELSCRFGRMSLGKYGTEMLVGDDDFTTGRSFEAIRFRYTTSGYTSDLMWVQMYQPSAVQTGGFAHPVFLSSFNTIRLSDDVTLDANLPFLVDQHNSGMHTYLLMPDARIYGSFAGFKYSAELISQRGWTTGIEDETRKGVVDAYAMELSAGYVPTDGGVAADATYYRASGDDDTADENVTSFNVLWQNGHRRFGFIDVFKGSNVQAATLHLDVNLTNRLHVGLHGVYANVLQPRDPSTGVATNRSQAITTTANDIGIGGDIYLNYFMSHQLNFQVATAFFKPGEYLTAVAGVDKVMLRLYAAGYLRF